MTMLMLVTVIQFEQVVVVVLMVKSEVRLGEEVVNSMYCIAVLCTNYLFLKKKVKKFALQ